MSDRDKQTQIKVRVEERAAGARIGFVSLDNAGKANTLNSPLMHEFIAAFERLGADDGLRAVVLSGEGDKTFIGGANLDEMVSFDPPTARAYITLCHRCCDAIRRCPMPVIARIQGHTIGAGLEIAASCDLRIASENARFSMPEVKLGVPSVIEAALLPTLIGWGRTREVLLLGEPFSAQEALSWGLIERLVPADALDQGVETWLAALLSAEPRAVRLQKRLMRAWEDVPLKSAVRVGIDCFAQAWESEEPGIAMRKFMETNEQRKAAARSKAG